MIALSSENQIGCQSLVLQTLTPNLHHFSVLSNSCMLVFLCVDFLVSLFLVPPNAFLSWNDVFKVPEVKKKVPEKKVVIPKKEEAPPATGTAISKNIPYCLFLSFIHKSQNFYLVFINVTYIIAMSLVFVFVKLKL